MHHTEPVEPARRRWVGVDLSGARFHEVDLTGVRFTGVWIRDVDIDGILESLVVNGVDVVPYVEQQLAQRHPELGLIWSDDPDDLREAWRVIRAQWEETEAEAARLDDASLRIQVDDEWSYLETLRHLVFATDAWLRRCLLGESDFWPAGVAHTDMDPDAAAVITLDPAADPSLDEVTTARRDRLAVVDQVLRDLTAEEMRQHPPRREPTGYPLDTSLRTVGDCVQCVLSEEWAHRGYAARDLAKLASR